MKIPPPVVKKEKKEKQLYIYTFYLAVLKRRGRHVSLCLPLVAKTCSGSARSKKQSSLTKLSSVRVTSVCPRSPTRTVRLTFDLAAHTGAASFITWMWSVVIGACGGVMNSAREHGASRDRPRLSGLILIGLGFFFFLEGVLHIGHGVAADEWLVILQRGLSV